MAGFPKYKAAPKRRTKTERKVIQAKMRDWGRAGANRPDDFEREEREAYPDRRLRHAYYLITGETPELGPADHHGAKRFLERLLVARERGGWTKNEWNALYKLEKKWRLRAEGRDLWFEKFGNRKTGSKGADDGRYEEYVDHKKMVESMVRVREATIMGRTVESEDENRETD